MLNLTELAVLGFAAARGTQLIVWDSLLDPVREKLELWHAARHDRYWPTFLRTLLGCIFCVGFHLSWVSVLVYLLATGQPWPGVWLFGVQVFAVAGAQMVVNMATDKMGDS